MSAASWPEASTAAQSGAVALLHRYSNLPKYLRILPRPPAQTPGALAERWWRLD